MAIEGVYDGPAVCQTIQLSAERPEVKIVRPFCLLRDKDLVEFGASQEFVEAPTGVRIEEHPFVEKARQAFETLAKVNPGTNPRTNFFNSQFHIMTKNLGTGEGPSRVTGI
jgi:hypothetical protein